ncbi:MAG: PilZ domain-containing protein [Pseudomonadota bacterium]
MVTNIFGRHEKRKFDRNQLFYYLKVLHDATDQIAGYLGDISTHGLMLFSKKDVASDQIFQFRLNLNKELDMDKNLVFEVRSLWCEKDVNPEYYSIGFKFIDLDQDGIDAVKYLIKKYGFDS